MLDTLHNFRYQILIEIIFFILVQQSLSPLFQYKLMNTATYIIIFPLDITLPITIVIALSLALNQANKYQTFSSLLPVDY